MIHQPAIAEHGHEHRDLAGRGADLHAAAFAPIDLHRLGRLVVDFLVDATACGTDLPQVAADDAGAAGIAIGAAGDLLADAHRREFGIPGQQGVDLGPVRIQEAGAARTSRAGGWSNSSAAATVCREQWSRREMARPESFSISARRRISAHKATFMASSFSRWNAVAQRSGGRSRPVASALGQARTGGAGRAAAGRAPG